MQKRLQCIPQVSTPAKAGRFELVYHYSPLLLILYCVFLIVGLAFSFCSNASSFFIVVLQLFFAYIFHQSNLLF